MTYSSSYREGKKLYLDFSRTFAWDEIFRWNFKVVLCVIARVFHTNFRLISKVNHLQHRSWKILQLRKNSKNVQSRFGGFCCNLPRVWTAQWPYECCKPPNLMSKPLSRFLSDVLQPLRYYNGLHDADELLPNVRQSRTFEVLSAVKMSWPEVENAKMSSPVGTKLCNSALWVCNCSFWL